MDVCAAPLPPPQTPDAKAAEVATVYDPLLEHLARMAVRFADQLESAEKIPLPEKVDTLADISTVVRRNALMARHLHEPFRTTAPPPGSRAPAQPGRRPYPRTPDGQIDYNKLTDEELNGFIALEQADIERREREEAERRETLDPRERLERLDPLDDSAADPMDETDPDGWPTASQSPGPQPAANPQPPAAAARQPDPPFPGPHPQPNQPAPGSSRPPTVPDTS